MRRRLRIPVLVAAAAVLCAALAVCATLVGAADTQKCRKDIWPRAFKHFQEPKPGRADCDDYDYRFVELNGDKKPELIAYRRSIACPSGGTCANEIFAKIEGDVRHIGTLPGVVTIGASATLGWKDLSVYDAKGERALYQWNGERYVYAAKAAPVPVKTIEDKDEDPWSALP